MASEISNKLIEDFTCEDVINLDKSIRFVGVCSNEGHLLECKYKNDINPLLPDKVLNNAIKETTLRHNSRLKNIGDMGLPKYTITSYENVNRATIPFDEKLLLLVSFEKYANEIELMKKILAYIKKN